MAQSTGFKETLSRATTPVLEIVNSFRNRKPRDKFKVEIVTGPVTLTEENRPATWKKLRQYFSGHEDQRKANYVPHDKHRGAYAKILETGRNNILTVLDYCRENGFEAPSDADYMLMRYQEWIDWLAHLSTDLPELSHQGSGDSGPTEQFPILGDPAIKEAARIEQDDRVLDAFNRAVAASLKDIQGENEDPDYGINDLFRNEAGPNDDWGTSTPRVEVGTRPKVRAQAPGHAQREAPPPRGAEIGPTVAGMSLEQLRWVVKAIVNERPPPASYAPTTAVQSKGCDSNKRYKDLEPLKFEGDRKEYPAFRQSLQLCLDRMDFPTGQDKAIYVYKFLKGPVREKCSYFMSTLTEHSYKHMLCFLDDGYGTDESYDLVAIERLAALPKLSELNQDNILDHLAVIGAATGPLMKLSPEALQTPNGEKYFRLLRTLPIRDQDQYFTECRMLKAPRTLETLTSFLRSKLRDRKHGRSLYQPETEKKPKKTKGKWGRRQRGNNSRSRGDKMYLNAPEGASDCSENSSTESEDEEAEANYAVMEGQCAACGEKHSLDRCTKMKHLDMDKRREAVRVAKACNCCLKLGHYARDCPAKKRCGKDGCKRIHHPLLHDEAFLRYLAMEEGCEPDLE